MREFFHKWFDTGKSIFVLTVIPVLFTIIFSAVYSLTYVEKIPLAVLDMDGSALSKNIVSNFENSEGFKLCLRVTDEADMERAFLRGEIKAGIILPANLEKDVREKRSPKVLFFTDGSNLYIGNTAYSYAANIWGTLSVKERVLYVPQMGNFVFAFAGYLGVFVQQTFMSVFAPMVISGKKPSLILKAWGFYALLTCVTMPLCFITAHILGGYPLRGSVFFAFLVHMVFILDITAVTIFIAALLNDVCRCVQFVMLLSIPTFLTSGYIWPEFAMPAGFDTVVKAVWPLRYFVLPMRDMMLKGAGFQESVHYIAGGLAFAAFWFPAAVLTARKRFSGRGDVKNA